MRYRTDVIDRYGGVRSVASAALILLAIPSAPRCEAQSAGARAKPFVATPLRAPLVKSPVAKGTVRAGFQVKAALPSQAYGVKVGAASLRFFDLDQDGKLAPGVDGMALDDAPFVVPIVSELLLREGQYKVEFTGMAAITLTPEDLGVVRDLVADASVLTEMRVRAGLKPFVLDTASCADCRNHCDYIVKNRLVETRAGLSLHQEDPENPGYTPGGAAAGEASNLWPDATTLRDALTGFYSTVWHGVPMFDPLVDRVGVAIVPKKIAMLAFVNQERSTLDFQHPADGATGIPCAFFGNGEVPNPAPGTLNAQGCGFPILMRLSGRLGELEWAEVTDPKGSKVAGTFSSPQRPATSEWPTNSNCAAFIPRHPLAPATTYQVRFKFTSAAQPIAWSFTTEASKARRSR